MAPSGKSLSAARKALEAAKSDLQLANINSKSRTRHNEAFKPGFDAVTNFAATARLSLKKSNFLNSIELMDGNKLEFKDCSDFLIKKLMQHLDNSTTGFQITKSLAIDAKTFLLILVNYKLLLKADENIVFSREHYCFPTDTEFISHQIRSFSKLLIPLRDFLLFSSIKLRNNKWYFVSHSVTSSLLPECKGCSRGTVFSGFEITPERKSCKVRYFETLDLNLWIPRLKFEEILMHSMGEFLGNCESLGKTLELDGKAESLAKKFVPISFQRNVSFHSDKSKSASEYSVSEYSRDYDDSFSESYDEASSQDSFSSDAASELSMLRKVKNELDQRDRGSASDSDTRSSISNTSYTSNVSPSIYESSSIDDFSSLDDSSYYSST